MLCHEPIFYREPFLQNKVSLISVSFKLGVTLDRHEPKLIRCTLNVDSQAKFHRDLAN
jgi:hypothetical protein